jgi:hypothetical protein
MICNVRYGESRKISNFHVNHIMCMAHVGAGWFLE